ncbi:MAG: type I phosphomannose isomerase catalytic subunit [Bacteroidota bacterium]
MLYPIKFKPILKDKIWGGSKLNKVLKKSGAGVHCGESWEISGIQGDISIVLNGVLKGNSLQELIEIYMGDLVGDSVYEKFGDEFPLLIKFIDASDVLSIQVHPDDEFSGKNHGAYGKTEMWYIINADEDSTIITGFKKTVDKKAYIDLVKKNKLINILNFEKVKSGDVFFIPSGRVHSIGKGILLAEIQQTSDVTYRIFDWNRKDNNGNLRELHNDLASEVIDFSVPPTYRTDYLSYPETTIKMIHCEFFNSNILQFNQIVEKNYNLIDSFIIYICLEGEFTIDHQNQKTKITEGETVLLPAILKNIHLIPLKASKLIEIYIKI